jgi:hypothetical protein
MLVHNFVDCKDKKKIGVIYIDILRLTHCQVVKELRAGDCEVLKLQITCLVAVKPLKQGTDDGEIATVHSDRCPFNVMGLAGSCKLIVREVVRKRH